MRKFYQVTDIFLKNQYKKTLFGHVITPSKMQYTLNQEGYDAIIDAYNNNVNDKTFKYVLNTVLIKKEPATQLKQAPLERPDKKFNSIVGLDIPNFIVQIAMEPENIKLIQMRRACKALCVKDPNDPEKNYYSFGKKKDEMIKVIVDHLNQYDDMITVARSNKNIGYEDAIEVLEDKIIEMFD